MILNSVKILTLLLLGISLTSQAQQTIPTSGGNATGSGGSVSYSVGQVVYTTNTGISGSVAQGVQQPFEISVVTGVEEAKGITLVSSVYPNPTNDYIKLKIENYQLAKLAYQLYDMNGKLIESKKIESNETTIAMKVLVASTYFLKVIDNNNVVKTFKIIKN